MATTPKGIYYPNNYNEIADIPEDMKKMAESIDEVFEDTDSDLSDIKEEQTTQNNRLNSLEVDNTTNKSDILTNKQEINNIKTEQTEQNTNISTNATNIESLQEENDNLKKIVSQLPQVEGQGTEVTLENTIEAPFTIFDVEGNSTQETTEGKNKVDVTSGTINIPSTLTLTQNADGTLTLNGNTGGTLYYAIQNMKFANIVNGNSYKLVTKVKSGTWNAGVIGMQFRDSNAQQIQSLQNSSSSQESKVINGDVNEVRLYLSGTFSATNLVIEIMLVEASVTDDSFEKFTYGASPNPNYEQPIYSAGDNENIIDINRTLGTPSNTGYDNTNKRTFDVTTLIKFLTANNYYNAGVQIDYSLIDNGIKITTKQAGYGIGFPVILSSTKTYTISANIDVIDNQMIRAIFYKEDGTYISNVTSSGTNKFLTFTTTDDTYFVVIMLTPKANVETTYSKIKLEKGNKATPYSPYGMGSINEKIQNKNLFNKNTITEGKYIDNNGNFVNDRSNFVSDFIKLLSINSNLSYRISATTGKGKRIGYYDNSKTFISRQLIPTTQGKLNIPENALYVRLSCYNDDLESLQLEIIEDGSTATPYVPHEEQDYSIFVQQPFRSIGDVRDCFVKKSDGWYERHYIGRYIFTGNEYFSTLSQGIYRFNAKANNVDTKVYDNNIIANALSNYFIIETATHIVSGSSYDGHFAISSTGTFDFNVQKFASATELKNWLAEQYTNGTPMYIDYPLAEPLDLPCTPEQINVLENLPSTYKDFTIIQSQDETPAYLEVSGIYDLNKLITRTEVLESEV